MVYKLKIGARPSPLAIVQAELVRAKLRETIPGLEIEIIPIRTSGDQNTAASLAGSGGKGLFIKELEQALSERRIDVAVHSMKDLPAALAPAYRIAATPERDDPADLLITRESKALHELPAGAKLGTSSPRRHFMALRVNPWLAVTPLRGNLDTRISRVICGELDATILAAAGLKRLGRPAQLKFSELGQPDFIPAAAQGALAVEALSDGRIHDSDELETAVAALNHLVTISETSAERAFLATIAASCVTPVGVKGTLSGEELLLRARLFSADGSGEMTDEITEKVVPGAAKSAASAGNKLGSLMLAAGAGKLLGHG